MQRQLARKRHADVILIRRRGASKAAAAAVKRGALTSLKSAIRGEKLTAIISGATPVAMTTPQSH